MIIIIEHLSLKFCLRALSKPKPNPGFLLCHPNQNYDHNLKDLSPVKLQPQSSAFNLLSGTKHASPEILDLLLDHLSPKPSPELQPESRESSSGLQLQRLFVLRVRKAEDRPVGVIIPPLPEEVFV